VTQIKFDSKVVADVADALTRHAPEMFKERAGHWMAVVELAHVERTEPGPEEEKEPSVKLRVTAIEVAPDDYADERLREVQRDLFERRTRAGTLGEVEVTVNGERVADLLGTGSGVLA